VSAALRSVGLLTVSPWIRLRWPRSQALQSSRVSRDRFVTKAGERCGLRTGERDCDDEYDGISDERVLRNDVEPVSQQELEPPHEK
jgi:hypothetical protein